MAFDQTTRSRLSRFVTDARTLLSDEFTRQLQHEYGLDPRSGEVTDLAKLGHLDDARRETAILLRETMEHYLAGSGATGVKARKEVLDRIVREQAFTVLNRLCALRMAEARGLLIESVARGYQSKGFQLYGRLTGTALGEMGDAYRVYLFSLCDEFAVDLPVLFDRFSPEGRLFPREATLLELLAEINHSDIDALWGEDETIGWIYQYFNSKEERKAMRDASAAPRNSRELAVRNQFFTPRYVVEFLTDNTLGRIWYEMTRGETALKEECRYLVRRPNEVFLQPGEAAPETPEHEDDLSQKELLRQPMYIAHRPLKDPRDLKMLDPACGSMHFGLYAFDLFERIYEEMWEIEAARGPDALLRSEGLNPLCDTYEDRDAFLRDVPRLIIERNIHGIDIDPRAVQIAGLSLWLRAQKSWQSQGVKSYQRPQIQRSNIICAEPMPGEEALLEEFIRKHLSTTPEHRVLGHLFQEVVEAMKLAGEAGSLLKIEEQIAGAIREAKETWRASPQYEDDRLYADGAKQPKPGTAGLEVAGIASGKFWELAEERIYSALEAYAEKVESGGDGYKRRLFAEDAARGFAFIDLCRQRYDVVLMNPPFGEPATGTRPYLSQEYPHSSGDIFHAFVERGIEWLNFAGREGVISARTGFFLGSSKIWREHIVFRNRLICFADLGLGVLDDALVEVAAYVVERASVRNNSIVAIRQLSTREKEIGLLSTIQSLEMDADSSLHVFDQSLIFTIPDLTFAYWAPPALLSHYSPTSRFGDIVGRSLQGVITGDDFRFVRLAWEVPGENTGATRRWQRFSKGGEYSPIYGDIHLVVDWLRSGGQIAAFGGSRFQNIASMFQPGATYTKRTASAFAARVLPENCVFSDQSQSWFTDKEELTLASIGYLSCRVPQVYLELAVGAGDIATSGSAARRYTSAVVENLPATQVDSCRSPESLSIIRLLYEFRVSELSADETSCHFHRFRLGAVRGTSLREAEGEVYRQFVDVVVRALNASSKLDSAVTASFRLATSELEFVAAEVGIHPTCYSGVASREDVNGLLQLSEEEIIARAVAVHGPRRWLTKKSYFVDRKIELVCHVLDISPETLRGLMDSSSTSDPIQFARSCISEAIGIVYGRWDLDFAVGSKPPPVLPDTFAPLPVCAPGQLQNEQGLPMTSTDAAELKMENKWYFPLEIVWDGVLADDPGLSKDIEASARQVLQLIWKERAESLEREACELLGVRTLRDYFRKPNGFFGDHLQRYSKSRRQAPVYWPLSSQSGSYTLWLYYHRLTDQTLYICVNDFVEQKLKQVMEATAGLRTKAGRSAAEERDLERLSNFASELTDFRDELLRIARFWKPNLNDGVQITAAPLWKLFQHKPWQKKLKEIWDKLEAGDYDWAHLAYSIWPDRVREKCRTDKSLAIAHGLEDLYEEPKSAPKKKRGRRKEEDEEFAATDLEE
jgi:hypothetical protein